MRLNTLQLNLPWSTHYSREFKQDPRPHKDMAHAIAHVVKAAGKLSGLIDDLDHRRDAPIPPEARNWLADLVICALRAATVFPGGPVEMERAVIQRIESKNNIKLPRDDETELMVKLYRVGSQRQELKVQPPEDEADPDPTKETELPDCENCREMIHGDCPRCFKATGVGCGHGIVCADCQYHERNDELHRLARLAGKI